MSDAHAYPHEPTGVETRKLGFWIFLSTEILFFGTLITTFLIPLFLILKKVHLYDEIRQVMFLVPFVFILGLVSIFTISKKSYVMLTVLMISLFIIESIKINPYQYVWFNYPSRFIDLSKKCILLNCRIVS